MEQSTLFKQLPGLEGNSISCQMFSPPNHVPCQLIGQTSYIHADKSGHMVNSVRQGRGNIMVYLIYLVHPVRQMKSEEESERITLISWGIWI